MTRRRCRRSSSPAAAASLLPDNDDLLREILLRLPPQPSSMPRVSAVCRRWRRIVADPMFMRQFYAHHRKPPIIGIFECIREGIVFTPMLDPPDRIPPQRFSLGRYSCSQDYGLLDCRHGLVLVKGWVQNEVVVCDPIIDKQRKVSVSPEFKGGIVHGAVLCAAGDLGHVHGGCHSSPFKVVLVSTCRKDNRQIAHVYSSETGIWGNLIAIEGSWVLTGKPAVLVGNRLYWLSMTNDGILEFDLDENKLIVISGPPITIDTFFEEWQIIQTQDGAVGYAIFCYPYFHIWQRNVYDHGVATWVKWKTIEMHSILEIPPQIEGAMRWIQVLGYNDDSGVIFLSVDANVYKIHLMSMQSRKLCRTHQITNYYPFTSFCTPGMDVAG